MSVRPVLLMGAGGHASVVAAALLASGRKIAGCIAPVPPKPGQLSGIPYLGSDDVLTSINPSETDIAIAVGSTRASRLRGEMYDKMAALGFRFATVIHPSAVVDSTARIGQGAQVMAGSIVQVNAVIGENAIINSGAVIEHDATAHARGRIDIDTENAGRLALQIEGEVGAARLPQRMRETMRLDGLEALEIQERHDGAMAGRIALECRSAFASASAGKT